MTSQLSNRGVKKSILWIVIFGLLSGAAGQTKQPDGAEQTVTRLGELKEAQQLDGEVAELYKAGKFDLKAIKETDR